ncbi:hypothetical protein MOV66_27185 [Agrobacterium sp. SHOUNA12C]|uniref:J domain-containing protein n=1 Tax=Rhizobium rhizogenes NBRC 13257 TaxID=1220581 RepID=A0AA87PZP7_RHIRH|nr:hypothetical protein [Rhizobium rhizogenes]MCJ9724710.1 hypothetical protein [Agrobacterium sp. BETTINA12B]MCJ9760354.1 hypothetical protein [Agrobacterium sp. SHOUNA12C]OCJ14591.1 hypothetical protein A6U89_20880 [Agrobacterium sp. B133/95]OCJ26358.1 hypothetical protein A6U88_08135 [Agrobacterium sp. B131/95]NTF55929.1 hypothetical protein [Rhizobium rhizogenes]
MLFGQSLFQSVLDRLETEDDKSAKDEAAHRIRGLNVSFVATVLGGEPAGSSRPDDAYLDNLGNEIPSPEPKEPEPPVMPDHLARTSREEVATDLAISPQSTLQSLHEKRRAFAKVNHPDSVAPPFREQATTRMMIANQLIDEALRRLAR